MSPEQIFLGTNEAYVSNIRRRKGRMRGLWTPDAAEALRHAAYCSVNFSPCVVIADFRPDLFYRVDESKAFSLMSRAHVSVSVFSEAQLHDFAVKYNVSDATYSDAIRQIKKTRRLDNAHA